MLTSSQPLALRLTSRAGSDQELVQLRHVVIASWTGRDAAALEARLVELEGLGIPRPPSLPMLYRVASSRVSTAPLIEVLGGKSSGEAEFVVLAHKGRLWIGVGSDHTDRALEAQDAAASKQLCEKPVGGEFWALDEVEPHWDSLRLRSVITEGSREPAVYQDGSVTSLRTPRELFSLVCRSAGVDAEGTLLFCGTVPTFGGIKSPSRFEVELVDPVLDRHLRHAYQVEALPAHLPIRP